MVILRICMFFCWPCFKGKVQRLGWFHADIWDRGLGFLDRAHDICYRREEPFICIASIQMEQYLLKSNDSDLLFFISSIESVFFGTSRASAKADFKAQWSLGPLELLCQSMRGSMCPCRWELGANLVGYEL